MKMEQIQHQTPGNDPLDDSKYSPQQKLDIKRFWAKLELGDLCFLQIVEYGIALFGQTKAGKTTLAHYLVKNALISRHNSSFDAIGYVTDQKSSKLTQAVIGLGSESQTQIPNECATQLTFQNKRVHLFDCPGYSDSKGSLMIVTNGYFHYRIFSKVKNLKFILTFDGDQFKTGMTFDKATNTILEFFNSFKDIASIKAQIFDATAFFFTKVQNQDIVTLLKNMKTAKFKAKGALIIELIDKILTKQNYYIFPRAEKPGERPKSQQFLKNIHGKTTFWSRNVLSHQEVDMSQIQISIASKIALMQSEDQSQNNKFELLSTFFYNRFHQAMGSNSENPDSPSLKNILLTFLNNSMTGKPQESSFYSTLLLKFVQKFYVFDKLDQLAQRNNTQSDKKLMSKKNKEEYNKKRTKVKQEILEQKNQFIDKCQIEWIQKLQISKLLAEFLQYYSSFAQNGAGFPKEVQFFKNFSYKFMKIIVKFKKIRFFKNNEVEKRTFVSNVENFCYIIYRLIEEAKTFKIIFGSTSQEMKINNQFIRRYDVTSTIFDTFSALLDQNISFKTVEKNAFQMAKINYISSVFEIKTHESLYYYTQIQKYCKSVSNYKTQQYLKKMMQLNTAKINSAKNQGNNNQKIVAFIQNIRNAIHNLKFSNSASNFEEYIGTMNELGFFLSKNDKQNQLSDQQIKKSLKFAIKIYKYVNNVHRVLLTYKQLIKLYNQEKAEVVELKQILLEGSQYASSRGRRQLGLQMLEHAYHLIDRIPLLYYQTYSRRREQREKLGEMIGFMGLQRNYNPGENYYDSLIMKRFCQIIEQTQLQEIQKKYPTGR